MVTVKGADPDEGGTKSPEQNSYVYDGLDRRDLAIGRSGQHREHHYLGMSELLSSEATGASSYDTYDYDSMGSRQGQASTDDEGTDYHAYGKDANGSVTEIEESDGSVGEDDTYPYDPYGELEDPDPTDESSPEDELGEEAQANPFRFQGFYYDSGVESYDMQAREYRPEVGRFLSQDRFAAAAGDLQLQSDPLTQDRFAFAGGNPIGNIEFDGHCFRQRGGWASTLCRAWSLRAAGGDRAKARRLRREFRESWVGRAIQRQANDRRFSEQWLGGKDAGPAKAREVRQRTAERTALNLNASMSTITPGLSGSAATEQSGGEPNRTGLQELELLNFRAARSIAQVQP